MSAPPEPPALDAGDATAHISGNACVSFFEGLFVQIALFGFLFFLLTGCTPRWLANKRSGLRSSVLSSLPVSIYRAEDFEEGLECTVCLSELCDGEEARLLPGCGHGFHLGCIDVWFLSHSTCPLCRRVVAVVSDEPSSDRNPAAEATSDPTTPPPGASPEPPVADGAGGVPEAAVVIEIIPRSHEVDGRRSAAEEMKPPISARWRLLRRCRSMGNLTPWSTSCSSTTAMGGDIEQGLGGC